MKKKFRVEFQIGKQGVTSGTIESLKNAFKDREDAKIKVLKSAGADKENVKKIGEKIVSELGSKFTFKIVGFTIFMKKWRKAR